VCGKPWYYASALTAEVTPVKADDGEFYRTHELLETHYLHIDNQICVKRFAEVTRLEHPEKFILREGKDEGDDT
jgi:hypothetical protein